MTTNGIKKNGTTDLGHEFAHAAEALDIYTGEYPDVREKYYDELQLKEWKACYYENLIRNDMNEPLRTNYGLYERASGSFRKAIPPYLLRDGRPFLPSSASQLTIQ